MVRLCFDERFLQQLPLAEIHLLITANDQLRFRAGPGGLERLRKKRTARGGAVLETNRAIRGVRGVRGRRVNVLAPPVFHALRKIKAAAPLSGSALTKLSLGRISRVIVEVQGKELRN